MKGETVHRSEMRSSNFIRDHKLEPRYAPLHEGLATPLTNGRWSLPLLLLRRLLLLGPLLVLLAPRLGGLALNAELCLLFRLLERVAPGLDSVGEQRLALAQPLGVLASRFVEVLVASLDELAQPGADLAARADRCRIESLLVNLPARASQPMSLSS